MFQSLCHLTSCYWDRHTKPSSKSLIPGNTHIHIYGGKNGCQTMSKSSVSWGQIRWLKPVFLALERLLDRIVIAYLVYVMTSRPASTTKWNPVSNWSLKSPLSDSSDHMTSCLPGIIGSSYCIQKTFLMLPATLYTVPHAAGTPTHKIILLLLHNWFCQLAMEIQTSDL